MTKGEPDDFNPLMNYAWKQKKTKWYLKIKRHNRHHLEHQKMLLWMFSLNKLGELTASAIVMNFIFVNAPS